MTWCEVLRCYRLLYKLSSDVVIWVCDGLQHVVQKMHEALRYITHLYAEIG